MNWITNSSGRAARGDLCCSFVIVCTPSRELSSLRFSNPLRCAFSFINWETWTSIVCFTSWGPESWLSSASSSSIPASFRSLAASLFTFLEPCRVQKSGEDSQEWKLLMWKTAVDDRVDVGSKYVGGRGRTCGPLYWASLNKISRHTQIALSFRHNH